MKGPRRHPLPFTLNRPLPFLRFTHHHRLLPFLRLLLLLFLFLLLAPL